MQEEAHERQCHLVQENTWLVMAHIWWDVVDSQFELDNTHPDQEDMQQKVVDPDSWGCKVEHRVQEEALDRDKTFSKGSLEWQRLIQANTYHLGAKKVFFPQVEGSQVVTYR